MPVSEENWLLQSISLTGKVDELASPRQRYGKQSRASKAGDEVSERKQNLEGANSAGASFRPPDWCWRYGLAAACVAGAFGIRYWLAPLIGPQSPFMVFAPAALLTARFGGLGPGMLALVAGLILGDYFFTPPFHSWGPYGPPEITLILTYTVTTAVGVLLFHLLARSKHQIQMTAERAQASAEQAHRRGEELEREIADRKRAEEEVQKAKEKLTYYAQELEERVTERTAELQESVRSLESVLYHVAHDLRAPLRAMQGFTTMLVTQYATNLDATGEDYATRISEAARRMDEFLRDLLDYGRACHVKVMPTKVELEKLVAASLRRFSEEIESKNAKVEIQQPLPRVWADGKLLEEVMANLLSNALKFVPRETAPRVQIWAEPRNGGVRIWIKDYGIGIEPQHQQRVFQVFERIDPTQTYSGTGIGLAIVQKLAQRMGGSVGLESAPGKGSRFWVELPAPPERPK